MLQKWHKIEIKAGDQEDMVCKQHGFVQSQYGPEDHSWSHPLMPEELPDMEIPWKCI